LNCVFEVKISKFHIFFFVLNYRCSIRLVYMFVIYGIKRFKTLFYANRYQTLHVFAWK